MNYQDLLLDLYFVFGMLGIGIQVALEDKRNINYSRSGTSTLTSISN